MTTAKPDALAVDGAPALPRRERGATNVQAQEEALDLFGDLEGMADGSRSSLGDFQRGQESARQEGRS